MIAAKTRRVVAIATYRNGSAMEIYRSMVRTTKFVTEAYMKTDATIMRCPRWQWKNTLQKNEAGK